MQRKGNILRKALVLLLTVIMLVGGASSALADGKGQGKANGKAHGKGHIHSQSAAKGKAEVKVKGNKIEIKLDFKDLANVKWAQKYIARLAADRVFDGYSDGTFRPNQPVKRIEAVIAAVRLMGLREEAESQAKASTKLNFNDADQIARKFPNAVGYVAVALEQDLFIETETKVQPEKAADRLWATMLLVKAMKLEDEAKAKMNAQLPFKDAKQIPAGAVGYVAVAIEKGLVSGYTDGSFRPDKPVTRAELAALLGRMDDQKPVEDQDQGGAATGIKGTVTAHVYSNVLTVESGGKTTAYAVDPGAFVFRNGAKVSVADLKVGDQIIAKAYNNVVIFIEVINPAADPAEPVVPFSEEGQYQYHSMNANGKIAAIAIAQTRNDTTTIKQFSVSDEVTITGNNGILTMGRTVVLKGSNQIVTSIEIK